MDALIAFTFGRPYTSSAVGLVIWHTDHPLRLPIFRPLLLLPSSASQAGDVLWFHFSGHGTQRATKDVVNEPDGLDEAVVPLDFE